MQRWLLSRLVAPLWGRLEGPGRLLAWKEGLSAQQLLWLVLRRLLRLRASPWQGWARFHSPRFLRELLSQTGLDPEGARWLGQAALLQWSRVPLCAGWLLGLWVLLHSLVWPPRAVARRGDQACIHPAASFHARTHAAGRCQLRISSANLPWRPIRVEHPG